LRGQVLPRTLGQVPGVSYAVAGAVAQDRDDIAELDARTPLVFAVVAVLALILLLIAFRSLPVALISVGLNLLSASAAFGLLTLIFQQGRLEGVLDFAGYGAIVPWVPLFMFVFLFGLSMDYHVFLLSRITELRSRGAETKDAVVGGVASSAGVVTSAALIMVAVFSIFATLSVIQLKMLGVGLAAAVLIDATVVRGILVPATLAALGDRSWYLPRCLSWLPGRPDSGLAAGRPDLGGSAGPATGLSGGGVSGGGLSADESASGGSVAGQAAAGGSVAGQAAAGGSVAGQAAAGGSVVGAPAASSPGRSA